MSTSTMSRQTNRQQLMTAEQVSNEIDRISDEADRVGDELDAADGRATKARAEYEYHFAKAFIVATGSVDARRYLAQIDTYQLRIQADTADLIVRQLKRKLDRIMRLGFEGARTKAASHRAETASFGPGSTR